MSKTDDLIKKYSEPWPITKEKFEAAKSNMPQEEFKRKYFIGSDNAYYTWSISEERELVSVILDRIQKHLAFIVVVTAIGLVAGLIYVLTVLFG